MDIGVQPPYPLSIVICTCNRCQTLKTVLEHLAQLKHLFQELIIINGPSKDKTAKLLKQYQNLIDQVINTDKTNISIARTLGIKAATQEIILSLDDDVIPTAEWILSHVQKHQQFGKDCAIVAGSVQDFTHPKYPLQFHHGINSILSESKPILTQKKINYYIQKNAQNQYWFPDIMGANVSYRRTALLEIGGFDPVFAYFLEETDIALRLIQAGYKMAYTDVIIAHYPAKSHNRIDQKHLTCWYELGKNTTYFALKHGFQKLPKPIFWFRLASLLIYRCLLRILRLKITHQLDNKQLIKYIQQAGKGIIIGYQKGYALQKQYTSQKQTLVKLASLAPQEIIKSKSS